MKKIILTAVAALALSATQASAWSSYYGSGYYSQPYASHGQYINIGSLDGYGTSYGGYGGIVPSNYRSSYSYPSTSYGYSYPYTSSYSYPSTSYGYSYPSYSSSYSYPYSSTYIQPARYRSGVVTTVPYTSGYTSAYGCRC